MTTSTSLRVGDLIELPRVRTVIQLADVESPELAGRLLEEFVLTADTDVALSTLLEALAGRAGQGFFLQGHFGSGKSHLLAVLDLLLRSEEAWQAVTRQNPAYDILRDRLRPGATSNAVACVSLVEHTGTARLEDISLSSLESAIATPLGFSPSFAAEPRAVEEIRAALESRHGEALRAFCRDKSVEPVRLFDPRRPDLLDELVRSLDLPFRVRRDRAGFFETLAEQLGRRGEGRVVLILDELSEFLRSKPDARAFNEDVRFLQFLGEASRRMPLWVVASLQEQIETTGEIDQATFGKIKDRYPVRLSLTGRHLRELAGARLIKKRPGAERSISKLYGRLKNAFTSLSMSESDFIALYPVHPATIELLDDLLPLFSRHRGAVDFLHHQLAGDPERRIAGMLDRPAESLLGPETILDHFRVRIHETLETAPYVTVVLRFYEKELSRIFTEDEDRETALRLLKILILGTIAPVQRRRSVAQLAEMLLQRVTDLDPAANTDYVRDLLESMRTKGAYVSVEPSEHPHQDVYFVDLAADVQLIIRRRVEALLKDPGFTLGRALDALLPFLTSTLLPLASLCAAPRSTRRVSWHKTRREGLLLFCRGEDDPLVSEEHLDEVHDKLATTELDFCIILLGPRGEPGEPEALLRRLRERAGEAFLVWMPRALGEETVELLRKAAARLAVRDHFRAEGSEVGQRVVEALESLLQEDRERAESLVQRAYREGRFLSSGEPPRPSPAELPSLPFDRVLERIAEIPLERRFPRHYRIAPTLELPTTEAVQEMVRGFFRVGELETRDVSEPLRVALDAHLRPLGLVKRTASSYRLQADPKGSDVVRFLLERVGAGRVDYDALYQELRKGPFGLPRPQFELMILALVFSGQLTAFSKGRKMSIETLDARALARVEQLGPGEMVSPELQSVLAGLPFIPPRFRKGTFGTAQQRELWDFVTSWKAETAEKAANVSAELHRARSYRSAAHLDLSGITERLARIETMLKEVKTSYPAREGLEKLALVCREEPDAGRLFEELERLSAFFTDEWPRYLFIQKYLSDAALDFPRELEDLAARRDRLREMASRADIPLHPEALRELREGFQGFLLAYGETYEREHARQKSPERIAALLELREGRSYRLLQRLSEIRWISVEEDRVKVDRWIDSAAAATCSRLSPEDLRSKPTCECGFRLGDRVEVPSAGELQRLIECGIRQYLAALRGAPYRENIEGSLFGLTEIGKESLADKARRLLSLEPEAPDALAQAEKLVDRELVGAVNAALAGDFVVVDRSLEDLTERLVERSFPKSKLLELVARWIDGDSPLADKDYVRVVSRRLGTSPVDRRLKEFVGSHYPELSPRWEQVGESAFIREAISSYREGRTATPPTDSEARITGLLGEAFTGFVREHPREAAEVLEAAERTLSAAERDRTLEGLRDTDDPRRLLEAVFEERGFRFVVEAAGARLLRMLVSDTLATRLIEALGEVKRAPLPAPLEDRLGVEPLRSALDRGVTIRKTTAVLHDLPSHTLDEVSAWEKLFRDHLALAHLAVAELGDTVRRMRLEDEVDLRPLHGAHGKELERVSGLFEPFYLDRLPGEAETTRKHPLRLEEVFGPLRRTYEKKLHPAETRFVLMDGMRWDVWHRLKARLLPDLTATYRVVEEVVLWSVYPTSTKTQLDRAGLVPPQEMLRAAEPASGWGSRDDVLPGFQRLIGPGGERVDRLNLVDDKVHESTADLVDLLQEIELHCRRTLAVFLEEARRGTLVLLFSDHGFVEDPRWRAGARRHRARYKHGGASPWEVLTPLAVLYRS